MRKDESEDDTACEFRVRSYKLRVGRVSHSDRMAKQLEDVVWRRGQYFGGGGRS